MSTATGAKFSRLEPPSTASTSGHNRTSSRNKEEELMLVVEGANFDPLYSQLFEFGENIRIPQ